jgi:hypothetical protein
MDMATPSLIEVHRALDVLTAAARAEMLPVRAYGDIARLRLDLPIDPLHRAADVERVDIEDDGFITVVPKVRDA